LTEFASSARELAKATWLPGRPWSGKAKQLRQGDLLVGYYHQLRTPDDEQGGAAGPGASATASAKLPILGEHQDREIDLGGTRLILRVWHGWMMVLEQSCEIEHKHARDSRLLVAPIAFRNDWPGTNWHNIRESTAPGLFFLPPVNEDSHSRYQAHGWPTNTDAAVVLESTTCVSRRLAPSAVFGLDGQMRAMLQQRLVDFWSVRGWMRSKHRDTILGRRITEISQTYEQFTGPGRLHKISLDDDGDGDEITVGFIFAP
jgi:hypothetical protein